MRLHFFGKTIDVVGEPVEYNNSGKIAKRDRGGGGGGYTSKTGVRVFGQPYLLQRFNIKQSIPQHQFNYNN